VHFISLFFVFVIFLSLGASIIIAESTRDIEIENEIQNESGIVFASQKIKDLLFKCNKYAHHGVNILITGETGTGKTHFAKAIHNMASPESPFISINCASIPDSLLESELFGHVKGAFTGAEKDKPGKFEQANGGTLFLDEIGELPLPQQAKLLKAIDEKLIPKVGGDEYAVQLRIIFGTKRNLIESVGSGTFRDDFYRRIKRHNIHIPPLRERKEDVKRLTHHFIVKYRQFWNKEITNITHDALTKLTRAHWKYNVSDLEDAISNAVESTTSHVLDIEDFDDLVENTTPISTLIDFNIILNSTMKDTIEHIEKIKFLHNANKYHRNVSQIANSLEITRKSARSKMARYAPLST
jgi:transcriptional regulator with PAS, ATPase and Fis domain